MHWNQIAEGQANITTRMDSKVGVSGSLAPRSIITALGNGDLAAMSPIYFLRKIVNLPHHERAARGYPLRVISYLPAEFPQRQTITIKGRYRASTAMTQSGSAFLEIAIAKESPVGRKYTIQTFQTY